MIVNTLKTGVNVLVMFSVWCAAIFIAVLALHFALAGGLTVYHLIHS